MLILVSFYAYSAMYAFNSSLMEIMRLNRLISSDLTVDSKERFGLRVATKVIPKLPPGKSNLKSILGSRVNGINQDERPRLISSSPPSILALVFASMENDSSKVETTSAMLEKRGKMVFNDGVNRGCGMALYE